MLNKVLFKRIDNTSLIVFRVMFGILIFLESVGAIFTGWVKRTLIEPEFTFTFIGFEWLQPLPGFGMYWYYVLMGIFGLMVMIGYKYRFSIIAFTLMWTATYLMQKTSYNNHYYLLILISFLMVFMPAANYHSVDAKINPAIKLISMPNWCRGIIILQLGIVYTFAALAKLYPDWLDLTVAEQLMAGRKNYPIIGELLQNKPVHYVITYFGIAFDFLIVPLLLSRKTRKWAFIAAVFFHLFNSIVFQIGIFPYLALAFTLFFFEPKTIKNIFLKKKELYEGNEMLVPSYKKPLIIFFGLYFIIQIGLPLRHWVIKDDVLWTEEGHRMSWRMMLRSKSGYAKFTVVNKAIKKKEGINLDDYLTKKQQRTVAVKPDAAWQFSQRLKSAYAKKGQDISVYVNGQLSVNGGPRKTLIDPKVDLAAEEWSHFKHHNWILPSSFGEKNTSKSTDSQ